MNRFGDLRQPVIDALVSSFGQRLAAVEGQTVYAAALAVADGMAWRPDLGTVEAQGCDDEWWPDEWTALEDVELDDRALFELDQQVDGTRSCWDDEDEGAYGAWLDDVYDLLVDALGSQEVRKVFADAGADPILTVNDTDGGGRRELKAFDTLNANHPRRDEAREFWAENCE